MRIGHILRNQYGEVVKGFSKLVGLRLAIEAEIMTCLLVLIA